MQMVHVLQAAAHSRAPSSSAQAWLIQIHQKLPLVLLGSCWEQAAVAWATAIPVRKSSTT